jgi:hypothetical protein
MGTPESFSTTQSSDGRQSPTGLLVYVLCLTRGLELFQVAELWRSSQSVRTYPWGACYRSSPPDKLLYLAFCPGSTRGREALSCYRIYRCLFRISICLGNLVAITERHPQDCRRMAPPPPPRRDNDTPAALCPLTRLRGLLMDPSLL